MFVGLALEDLRRAADLFRPVYDATEGADGWVSMELSPLLANDTARSIDAAARIYRQADRRNLFVKIPGTPEGVPAIEASIFAGVPINVTLPFSREQCVTVAEAYLRGIERRLAAGLNPRVAPVASLFVGRWDNAVNDTVPANLRNRLGIAIAARAYRVHRELLASQRWRTLAAAGALSVCSGPAPGRRIPRHRTRCTSKRWPRRHHQHHSRNDTTRLGGARRAHRRDGRGWRRRRGVVARVTRAGIDVDALAKQLQRDGATSFVSWHELLQRIDDKSAALADAGRRSR